MADEQAVTQITQEINALLDATHQDDVEAVIKHMFAIDALGDRAIFAAVAIMSDLCAQAKVNDLGDIPTPEFYGVKFVDPDSGQSTEPEDTAPGVVLAARLIVAAANKDEQQRIALFHAMHASEQLMAETMADLVIITGRALKELRT